jgi:hypothetical protein
MNLHDKNQIPVSQDLCQHHWKYLQDRDCGDWDEEVYECENCGAIDYRELPD